MCELRVRERRAPSCVGNNMGLMLDGPVQAMPLASDGLKGLEPLRPVSFSGERRLISPSFVTALLGSTQVLQGSPLGARDVTR